MNPTLEQAKEAARAEVRHALEGVRHQLPAISHAVCRLLGAQAWWHQARTVLLFAPMPGEIDLGPLAIASITAGQSVGVPRVDWVSRGMSPIRIESWPSDLTTGKHGVPEPRAGLPAFDPGEIDVVVTPGLGFDLAGRRLGRGAGFYDRFLGNAGLRGLVVGVCPEAAIRDTIPAGATDVPVQRIVTERRVISCGGS